MKSPLQKQREIPPLRRPTISQERKGKKKSACSVRNDVRETGANRGEWAARARGATVRFLDFLPVSSARAEL